MGATSEGWGWWFREGQFSAGKTVFQRQTTGHTSMRQSLIDPWGSCHPHGTERYRHPRVQRRVSPAGWSLPDSDLTGCAGEGRRPGDGGTHSFQKLLAPSVWALSSRSPGSGANRGLAAQSAALGDCRLEAGTWAQDDWSWAGRRRLLRWAPERSQGFS